MKIHLAKEVMLYGEKRVKSLCGRAVAVVVNADTIETGQNVTHDKEQVTCFFCQKLMKRMAG